VETSVTATTTYNSKNQVTGTPINSAVNGFSYDDAGNVTNDNVNQYLYDAEGRVCAVQSRLGGGAIGYLYDAEGRRVAKGTISSWSCDPEGNGFQLTETYVLDQSGRESSQITTNNGTTTRRTNVYGAGRLLATYDTTNGLQFQLTDPLGTRRVQTDANGMGQLGFLSLPYGDQSSSETLSSPAADDSTPLHFTGKERDTESGNDYFGARYYESGMGRFISPDPSGLTFADPTNPQSLNLYAYALNNPLRFIDPSGLTACFYGGVGDTPQNDTDPTDYETVGSEQECANNGGVSLDANTTVNVSANANDPLPTTSGSTNTYLVGGGTSTFVESTQWDASNFQSDVLSTLTSQVKGMIPNYALDGPPISNARMRCENGLVLNGVLHGVGAAFSQLKTAGGAVATLFGLAKTNAPTIGVLGAEGATALGATAETAAFAGGIASGAAEVGGVFAAGYIGYSGIRGMYDYMTDPQNSCAAIP
jgi:RHS repeat-associated protein